ncbi:hypothetical protein RRF57_011656 [Xylaria bambusicola]|uniref:Uncharacterized protein n=1 Tax=Xylaria bambusicola TaxID=326684 RepID=A0AAN7V4T5_9PEZI
MQPGTDDVVESDVGKDDMVRWEVLPLPVRFEEAGVVEKYPCSGPIPAQPFRFSFAYTQYTDKVSGRGLGHLNSCGSER